MDIMQEARADGYLVIPDADQPDTDFFALRQEEDGIVQLAIFDSVNTGPLRFSSLTVEEAKALAVTILVTIN